MAVHGKYDDDDIRYHCLLDDRPDPSEFKMHTHEFCELYCILSGRGVFRIEGSEYELEPGNILVMRPNEAHCVEPDPSLPYERLSVHFRKNILERMDPDGVLLAAFYNRDPGRFNMFSDEDFPDLSHRLYLNTLMQPALNRRIQILAGLVPLLNVLSCSTMRRGDALLRQDDTTMHRIIRYINLNLSSRLTLDELCDRFFISKPQLCRAFKRATGASVGEYITVKRLLGARDLLRSGAAPTRVCASCGFNDYSAFYRAYKKQFGVSPQADHAVSERKI